MHSSKHLLDNLDSCKANLARRGFTLDVERLLTLQQERKNAQIATEEQQSQRNHLAKKMGQLKSQQLPTEKLLKQQTLIAEQSKSLSSTLEKNKQQLTTLQQQQDNFLAHIPNLLDDSVPDGISESANKVIASNKNPPTFDFTPKDHTTIGKSLHAMDFSLASELSGARFCFLSGPLAALHRALTQFMLQTHIERGYLECHIPQLVYAPALFGTGQLPKFANDLFATQETGHYLIPTAEVVLVNSVREKILSAQELPIKLTAASTCYRKEAGSYGKDTHGLIRQHQFEKVELVQIVAQGAGKEALETITQDAERILQLLDLAYRKVALCAGDTGFSAKKTYDLEVWVPSQNAYREISSCSWCGDFQSRRMRSRYKDAHGNKHFTETLNGSGLAVGRTLLALLENFQRADGSVVIPHALRPFLGNIDILQAYGK